MNKEYLEIVDENGNPTGEILERSEAHKRNLLHNEIAVLLVNDSGETLLQKRSANKKTNPNKWAICAGHVSAGDTLKQTAVRELEEEIGLKVNESDLIEFTDKKVNTGIDAHITSYYCYKTNKNVDEFIIQTEELSEVKWVPITDVIDMINNEDTTTIFNKKHLIMFEKLRDIN